MEPSFSLKPLLAVLVSLLAAVLILLSGKRPNLREFWTILAAFLKLGIIVSMLPFVLEGGVPGLKLFDLSPGIALAFRVDPLGMAFAVSASLLWVLTSFFSIGYMRSLKEKKQSRYFASFALCLSATIGIAFSANLLTFFIFYEVLTIATYPLVIHKETPEAIAAGRKYLTYLLTAGLALLAATAWTYSMAGSGDFVPGGVLSRQMGESSLMILFVLFVLGVGTKSALLPLHSWLPSAMVAPAPVSALLHAVAVVKAGVFGFARVIGFVFGPGLLEELGALTWLAALAGLTIVVASLLAMAEDNLKLRLAYSTIGHLSYIVLGITFLAPSAWAGGLFHIVAHAVMKITLFFCAGAIYAKTHLERVSQLDGLGKKMPLTLGAFAVASLGLAGVPPVVGFLSKWYLALGMIETQQLIPLFVLLLSGLLNAGYLLPVVSRAFFKSAPQDYSFDEPSAFMVVPLLLTAALSLLLGVWPNAVFHFYQLTSHSVSAVLGGGVP